MHDDATENTLSQRRYGPYTVEIGNEDKLLFPANGIRKGALIDYYESAWERMRSHLRDRPLVMERYPDGIDEGGFYHKQVPDHFPRWLDTVRVRKADGDSQRLVVCNARAGLVYLANQACITPHLWLSRRDELDRPDQLVFDLDPPDRDFEPARRAARWCRALLDELELFSVVKTTGSRGLHLIVPLRPEEDFDTVRAFAREVAGVLAARHPDALTTEQRVQKRRGRLYLDVARNATAQTVVAPWAVRAKPGAPIATPIAWSELGRRSLDARSFRLGNIRQRLEGEDPWQGWRRHARGLEGARARLASLQRDDGATPSA